jgi:predicted phage tail protein
MTKTIQIKAKDKERRVQGHGFGGSKQPVNEEDDGRSTAFANLVEIISEGPIQGIKGHRKGIFLDNTQVANNNGKQNFKGFKFVFRKGTIGQAEFPAFAAGVNSETEVGVQVLKSDGPITRNIINPELDKIRVRIALQLQKQTKKGVKGEEIHFRIFTKQGTAPFVRRLDRKIHAKFASPVEFEYEFKVNNQGGTVDQFAVRVSVITDDGTDEKIRSLRWQSYTEMITNKLNYQHTAAIAMQFNAEQFNAVPSRSYRIAGRTVRIPSNSIVAPDRGLNFTSPWDGTLITTPYASADPVWQLYDLLSHKRYGLGKYINVAQIDLWSLYSASVYNNEMVANGFGGFERRYTCNTMIQSKESAWEVINAFCGACNMKAYYADGNVSFWQDTPGPVIRQFTQADIENGDFVYASTAVRSRYTVALVTWNDPKDFYKRAIETVEDPVGIAKYGIRDTEITAFGCTSRGQAIRMGRWALFSSQYETETVTFTCRSWAAYVRPGEIIQVANARRANVRYGGLISNATTTSLWLDSLVVGVYSAQISVMMPNGELEQRAVSSIESVPWGSKTVTKITVANPFSAVPNPESNWLISTPSVKPELFRVLSVAPTTNDPTRVEIVALQYYEGKYAKIENNDPIEEPPERFQFPTEVSPPQNVRGGLVRIEDGATEYYSVTAQWSRPRLESGEYDPTVAAYRAEFAPEEDISDFQGTLQVPSTQFEARFENLPRGSYRIRVASIDFNGRSSDWVYGDPVAVGDVTLRLDFSGGRRLSLLTRAW